MVNKRLSHNPTEDTPTPDSQGVTPAHLQNLGNIYLKQDDKQLLGKLIAEISKFGGASKEDASRLARILLPHIGNYVEAAQIQLVSELLKQLKADEQDGWTVVRAITVLLHKKQELERGE